ncbi:hypothetical protein CALVIDRAFT_526982 [Calocera viscosa TUFC12733]|uniref:Extracellular membrane protein CFEM domain-containing protein n=1 Tax=Calocera viscosa (strain TUFC12733) TaxID=1330018 RepID=A0A167MTU1_CALVF|nr:hypothetical protein CALVIDRAFT_526982 [Calocera viscosa TUFC12733]
MRVLLSLSFLVLPLLASASNLSLSSRQSASACVTTCSSASDTTALSQFAVCSSTDLSCLCTTTSQLSSACLQCILGNDGVTQAEYAAECSAAASGGSVTPTLPAGGSTPTLGASAPADTSGPSPPDGGSCQSSCSGSDATAYSQFEQCTLYDLTCICSSVPGLSSTCTTCIATAIQITPAQLATFCSAPGVSLTSTNPAAASTRSGSGSAAGSGSGSALPSSPSGQGKSAAGRVAVGGVLGMVLGAMVVLL